MALEWPAAKSYSSRYRITHDGVIYTRTLQLDVGDPILIVAALAVVLVVATVWSMIEIVDAYNRGALTVFGVSQTARAGAERRSPFVSRVYTFDMRTQTIDVPSQEAITRDNSPVTADAVVYIRVMDAKRAFLEVENYERAVSNLAQTTLRAVLGDMELDDTLSKREMINERIRHELDEPTDEWGSASRASRFGR
ncbi:paraslipin [Natrialba swarupiae]|nr:paraslipin [Natrialba swarupiae]